MRILVLGGYGLIGSCVVRHLIDAGHEPVGLGRDIARAQRLFPNIHWIAADLAKLTSAAAWQNLLNEARAGAIVNCAGALQDGSRDNVAAVQSAAMRALYAAAPSCGVSQVIQISAPGASLHARTTFMRSKAEADLALQATAIDWTVLRPGLVLSPQAYGGTALLRSLAAFPLIQPLAFADSLIQTVAVDDIGKAVVQVIDGTVPPAQVYDLVEDKAHTLRDIVAKLRAWQGLPRVRELELPSSLVRVAGRMADALSWLGWRSPLRTTALTELAAGVTGDPASWRSATGASLTPLDATLRRLPATVQEQWFARTFIVKPIAILTLAVFWMLSGTLALTDPESAARVLTSRGVDGSWANALVFGGAIIDIGLGLGVLARSTMAAAANGMILVSLAYLVGATMLAPGLWHDPLGPLVKVVPGMVLALFLLAVTKDR